MKAAAFVAHGSTDIIEIMELPRPEIERNEVLIEVKSFALNRLDLWTRIGMPALNLQFPHIAGSDFSGVIVELGDSVMNFNIGDRVAVNSTLSCTTCIQCRSGEISLCSKIQLLGEHVWGGAAEFAKVPASNLIKLPDHITHSDAAAIALTALTTYRMMVTRAKVKPGETVLVTGSGGGIGTIATQLGVYLGAEVLALTSSSEKEKLALELGARAVFNYKLHPDWGKEIWNYTNRQGVDVVIDSSGELVFEQAVRSLAKGGRYVTCGATTGTKGNLNLSLLFWKQLSVLGSTMASHKEFEEVMSLFFKGKIKPIIDTIFNFDDIKNAHKRLEDPLHIGKIVVNVSE